MLTAIYRPMPQTNGGPDRIVGRGLIVTLAPGFTNAKRRHASDLPWYVRHPTDPMRPSPKVRAPLVATCRCGQDVPVERIHGEATSKRRT